MSLILSIHIALVLAFLITLYMYMYNRPQVDIKYFILKSIPGIGLRNSYQKVDNSQGASNIYELPPKAVSLSNPELKRCRAILSSTIGGSLAI